MSEHFWTFLKQFMNISFYDLSISNVIFRLYWLSNVRSAQAKFIIFILKLALSYSL